jgi:hypothetical protein
MGSSGMSVMRAYPHGKLANKPVLSYACTSGPAKGQISCVSGKTTVTALANH